MNGHKAKLSPCNLKRSCRYRWIEKGGDDCPWADGEKPCDPVRIEVGVETYTEENEYEDEPDTDPKEYGFFSLSN